MKQYADGLSIEDEAGGCVLEVSRAPGYLPLGRAVKLYERFYMGKDRLADDCRQEISEALGDPGEHEIREYLQREWGWRVHSFFAQRGRYLLTAMVRCPRGHKAGHSWATSAAIFSSIREVQAPPARGNGGSGFFAVFYFLVKMPVSQLQNPCSGVP